MAMTMKIKHVDTLKNGVLRFRRKFPKDVAEALDQPTLQVHIRNREGLAFQREYAAILREFDRIVEETREKLNHNDTRPKTVIWHEALLKAEGMLRETTGLEDDETYARGLIAHGLAKRGDADPMLIEALLNPEAEPPKVTLHDARLVYAKDNGLTGDKDDKVRLDRICRRLEEAIGPLDQMPLEDLRREHGRTYMETLLRTKKDNGQSLALGSCKREARIVAAMVNHAIREFDLVDKASNPFSNLPWPKEDTRAVEKKLPLPDALVDAVEARLDEGRTKELPLLWRLLKGTGMRLGEAAGLVAGDLDLAGETPCVHVRPNAVRSLKTTSSTRSVPLTGDALVAAREAVAQLSGDAPVFPSYARPRGSDAASAALMKHVRAETDDKRMTVHGLRHRVSDKLRDAGAPVEVRHGFLGHASQAIAETTYGSPKARLKEFLRWAVEAGLGE